MDQEIIPKPKIIHKKFTLVDGQIMPQDVGLSDFLYNISIQTGDYSLTKGSKVSLLIELEFEDV